ncbi:hypothetical protein IQ07DRAFT_641608 [Pyrenochaeta sp. DS3sAY3a]|nr:hypothetical protein IQ07DRAFT_641608 [Pyrenochaeta sp. DS3sAY3a]
MTKKPSPWILANKQIFAESVEQFNLFATWQTWGWTQLKHNHQLVRTNSFSAQSLRFQQMFSPKNAYTIRSLDIGLVMAYHTELSQDNTPQVRLQICPPFLDLLQGTRPQLSLLKTLKRLNFRIYGFAGVGQRLTYRF